MHDPDLQTLLEEATIYLEARKFEGARAALKQGLSRWPGEASILVLLAQLKELEEGKNAFRGSGAVGLPPLEGIVLKGGRPRSRLPLYLGLGLAGILGLFLFCRPGPKKDVLAAFDAYQR